MKKQLLVVILLFMFSFAQAQTWSEWFQQKKTQINYLVSQIAALKVYSGYVEKGFGIAKQGLTTMHQIKTGDFSIHEDYFTSLKHVSPKVKSYWKVAAIVSLQIKIMQACNQQHNLVRNSHQFTRDEIAYTDKVVAALLKDCSNGIEHLILLTTDGAAEMKDGERLKSIDALYTDMQDKYAFTKSFGSQTSLLAVQRMREEKDIKTNRSLIGIH
jgi:hypothetical protein